MINANGFRRDPMDYSREMVACLEAMDVRGMEKLWSKIAHKAPMPKGRDGMITAIHMARTKTEAVRFKLRAYSHQWLTERGLPSLLPDQDKPKAHRIYPVTKSAVGIAVKSKFEIVKTEVSKAMQNAVLDAEAEGRLTDTPFVKMRMNEARGYALRKLFGR